MRIVYLCCIIFLAAPVVAQVQQTTRIEFADEDLGANTDYTALYRDDMQSDQTVLKMQLGDEHHGFFEGGYLDYTTNTWRKTFSFDGYGNGYFKGNLGIGVERPSVKLEVNANNFTQAITEKAVALRMFNGYHVAGRL